MARQYSPKDFLRRAPNKLLRRYLQERGVGSGIRWDDLREMGIAVIFKAVDVNGGLLVKGSPHGIWEITDRGRAYLKGHSKSG